MRKTLAALGITGSLFFGATEVNVVSHPATIYHASTYLTWNNRELAVGEYGLDETGDYYWVHKGAETIQTATTSYALPDRMEKVSNKTDMTGYTAVPYTGTQKKADVLDDQGCTHNIVLTDQQFTDYTTKSVKDASVSKPLISTPCATAASVIAGSDTGKLTGTGAARTSDSYTVTVASTGANEAFVVVGTHNIDISSVTIGGAAMTFVNTGDGTCQNHLWAYKLAPSTGSQTLTFNFSSLSSAVSYRGVTLQDILSYDVQGLAGAGSASAVSKSITTTAANDLVMAEHVVGSGGSPVADTWSATDVMIGDTSDFGFLSLSYKIAGAAGSVTASYSNGGSQCPGIGVFSFKDSPAATGIPTNNDQSSWFMLF